jgi:hypothetical protein
MDAAENYLMFGDELSNQQRSQKLGAQQIGRIFFRQEKP